MELKDKFQIDLTIRNLQNTVNRMPELEQRARATDHGQFYVIGYLEGTVKAALARLEAFAAANE
tara:strand:- start:88 stop:279 length:192 start_codon:yes stop_codon:yes gene_type:complete